jgi:hypothetical protein
MFVLPSCRLNPGVHARLNTGAASRFFTAAHAVQHASGVVSTPRFTSCFSTENGLTPTKASFPPTFSRSPNDRSRLRHDCRGHYEP